MHSTLVQSAEKSCFLFKEVKQIKTSKMEGVFKKVSWCLIQIQICKYFKSVGAEYQN